MGHSQLSTIQSRLDLLSHAALLARPAAYHTKINLYFPVLEAGAVATLGTALMPHAYMRSHMHARTHAHAAHSNKTGIKGRCW